MPEGSRLDVLEGRVEEQSKNWTRVYSAIARIDQKIDQKIDFLRDDLLDRIDAVDRKFDGKLDGLSDKIDRHFMWMVGIQIGTLVAIIGALLRR